MYNISHNMVSSLLKFCHRIEIKKHYHTDKKQIFSNFFEEHMKKHSIKFLSDVFSTIFLYVSILDPMKHFFVNHPHHKHIDIQL